MISEITEWQVVPYDRPLGLKRDPFSIGPDPAFFYQTKDHKAALYRLLSALHLKRGLSLILGAAGTGKTSLGRRLQRFVLREPRYDFHLLTNPSFASDTEFLAKLAELFRIDLPKAGLSTAQYLDAIEKNLLRRNVEEGRTVVLLIDEAQKLELPCLEILRVLLNYETNEHKLLQLILLSQVEILPKLMGLKNLWDRVGLKYVLHPLDRPELKRMIEYRLREAGYWGKPIFSRGAVKAIHRHTRGSLRKATALCHDVLERLVWEERKTAGRDLVRKMIAGDVCDAGKTPKSPPGTWRVPRLVAGTALVSLLALAINAAGFLAVDFVYDGTLASFGAPQAGDRLQAGDASQAGDRLQDADRWELADKVALLDETLGDMERLAGKLAALVGTERVSLQKGVGPIPEPLGFTVIDPLDSKVESMEDRAIALQARIKELVEIQEDKSLYIASIPSLWPVRGWVTSDFGSRRSPFTLAPDFHEGVDIAAALGTSIVAPADGIVTFAGYKGGYGKTVVIDHGFGMITKFAHTSELSVQEGQKIARGDKIASVGNTGHSTGPHLHYEIHADGMPVDPMRYILEEN